MTAYLIVRAEVPETDRDAFDHWYATEHLPDAHGAFKALSAKRGWSDLTPGIHIAIYEFPDLTRAREIGSSDYIDALIAEFDRVWQDRVVRTREIIEVKQTL
jgi:hypothetical protein